MRTLTAFFLLLHLAAFSQLTAPVKNLVPNGSFENFRRKSDNIRQAIPWTDKGTADLYHNALDNDTTAQKGAHGGYCYAGLRFQKSYREYLQVKLAEPLHRGTTYDVTVHLRLAFWSNATLRSFGLLFTKGGYNKQADAVKADMVDTVLEKGGLSDGFRWFTVKGRYKAGGGEKYMTIGNFAPDIRKDLRRQRPGFGFREAYYFIDDISLTKSMQDEEKVEVVIVGPDYRHRADDDSVLQVKGDLKLGEAVTLNNIFFENGRYYLLPESYAELNKLAQYLLRNPGIEIRINGHSDNSGLRFRNQKISELRAREVFEYLIKKGVQNKMYFKGFGSDKPIADNTTDIGRAKNRRVEFEIIRR